MAEAWLAEAAVATADSQTPHQCFLHLQALDVLRVAEASSQERLQYRTLTKVFKALTKAFRSTREYNSTRVVSSSKDFNSSKEFKECQFRLLFKPLSLVQLVDAQLR